jgi:hypothetical protein
MTIKLPSCGWLTIKVDITFRILVGLGIITYTLYQASLGNPTSWFGYTCVGAVMVVMGSKAFSSIKTPWFSVGNGNGDEHPQGNDRIAP